MNLARFFSRTSLVAIFSIACAFIPNRAAAQHPIGIDVSDYQGRTLGVAEWTYLRTNYGIQFAWIKSSEGNSAGVSGVSAANFASRIVAAKAAGVPTGAYHYARYDLHAGTAGAQSEAATFWNYAKPYLLADKMSLEPMLDVEASFTGQNMTTISTWVNAWCVSVSNSAAATGLKVRPSIYTSTSKAQSYMDSSVTIWPTDLAAWHWYQSTTYNNTQRATMAKTDAPTTTPWTTWQFWQYDDHNISEDDNYTTGDGDVFNGTFQQMTNTMLIVPFGPSITDPPDDVTAALAANVSFTVGATGSGTLAYQWAFNGTNISGATRNQYAVTNIQFTNAGGYSVKVTDTGGSVVSSNAFLGVVGPITNGLGGVVCPTNLVNWWPADGNTRDIWGPVTGSPKAGFMYGPGLRDQGFYFNGTSGYITNSTTNLPVPWTISFWVNRQDAPGTSACLFQSGTNALKLEQYNGTRNIGLTVQGVSDYVFSPAYSVPQNTWTHLVFVGTASGITLYVNGVSKSSLAVSIPLSRSNIGANWIANATPPHYVDYMKGTLDEIMTFSRALTAPEISAIYSCGNSGVIRSAEIVSSKMTGPNQFTIQLMGFTGKNFNLYKSADLINWVAAAAPITNPRGTNQYIDNSVSSQTARFYRVIHP